MKARLNKVLLLKLYCYCREAERSVHRALSDPWADFRAYYAAEKRYAIQEVIAAIRHLLGQAGGSPTALSCNGAQDRESRLSFVRFCLGRWLARWEKSWSFLDRRLGFITATLASLVELFGIAEKPAKAVLIELRMNLCDCQRIIEQVCYGLAVLKIAQNIDHFNKTEWLPHVTLADVLKQSA